MLRSAAGFVAPANDPRPREHLLSFDNLLKCLSIEGSEVRLEGKKLNDLPTLPKFNRKSKAKLIATCLGKLPEGVGKWTLQLLADQLLQLRVVDSTHAETIRQMPKKSA